MRVFMSVAAIALIGTQSPSAQEPLTLVRSIDLPRVEGRIDHLAFDAAGQRLFVAALGNNTVEVVDVKTGNHIKSLPGFREPQGIAFVPDVKLVAVANGHGEGLQLLNADDYRATQMIRLGDDSDNVRYDASAKRIYVGFGSGALAAISPADAKVLAEAKLGGHPESFQLEPDSARIFVNVPGARQIAVVDRRTRTVSEAWLVPNAKANFPMALDERNNRLFIGCRDPAKLAVLDTASGKSANELAIVGDADDLFYDAKRRRIYVSGGESFVDVIEQQDANHYKLLERIPTAPGARTSFFSPDLDQFYLAVPRRGEKPAEIRVYRAAQ